MLPSVMIACKAIFSVAPVLNSFHILSTYLEAPGRKKTDFQSFLSCGWTGTSVHQDPKPSPSISPSLYMPASVLLLLCSKMGTDPKHDLR